MPLINASPCLHGRPVADAGLQRQRAGSERLDGAYGLRGRIAAVVDCDVCAFAGEFEGDAAGGPGDERNFSV